MGKHVNVNVRSPMSTFEMTPAIVGSTTVDCLEPGVVPYAGRECRNTSNTSSSPSFRHWSSARPGGIPRSATRFSSLGWSSQTQMTSAFCSPPGKRPELTLPVQRRPTSYVMVRCSATGSSLFGRLSQLIRPSGVGMSAAVVQCAYRWTPGLARRPFPAPPPEGATAVDHSQSCANGRKINATRDEGGDLMLVRL